MLLKYCCIYLFYALNGVFVLLLSLYLLTIRSKIIHLQALFSLHSLIFFIYLYMRAGLAQW